MLDAVTDPTFSLELIINYHCTIYYNLYYADSQADPSEGPTGVLLIQVSLYIISLIYQIALYDHEEPVQSIMLIQTSFV